MRYGYFDNLNCEYVIDRPDTPWPWINYLGDHEYGAIISNNAGGYSFLRSPGQNRLLRYRFNAVPCDRPGRYIYLRDSETGEFWSHSWSPTQKPLTEHHTECRHGLGYTRITSSFKEIASEACYFVPLDDALEIWNFRLTNRSRRSRTIDVFTYCEFGFPVFTSETALQAILYVASTSFHNGIIGYATPIPGWRTRHSWFASTVAPIGFDTKREAFVGPWRGEDNPLAVELGHCTGSVGAGGNAVGCLHLRFSLEPGESSGTAFLLGEGLAGKEGEAARARYTPEHIAACFAGLKQHWRDRLANLQTKTPDPDMDAMLNVWNPYQAHATFHWSRSATLIEAGLRDGLGYRDTAQDCLAVMHTEADLVRGKIIDLLRGQERRGCALHKVQPLTLETGKGESVPEQEIWSDDHLWLALSVGAYVRETGDLAFLNQTVPWLDKGEGTILDHLVAALEYARANRGPHGLLLCLAADWNDALQLGREGQSVFVSMQFCKACSETADLLKLGGRGEDAGSVKAWRSEMVEAINTHGWDGSWYLRARMNDGSTIGSEQDKVAKIWLEPQPWSVISGVGDNGRGTRAMGSVAERLASDHGIHLFMPPHQGYEENIPGRVCYPPGYKENAAIFCHPNPWAMVAECMLGNGDRAYRYYRALLPSAMNERAELRHIEPYVYGQFVVGSSDPAHGTAHNPWLTGTASWAYVAATQWILGIRPQIDGLLIDPCIPSSWDGFHVRRVFRGATYEITIKNPQHLSRGIRRLCLDGKEYPGNLVPVARKGSKITVSAELQPE